MITLGSKVRCVISGLEGIATARIEYINGCVQYCVKPPVQDGKSVEAEYIDQQQLETVDGGVIERIKRTFTGGPASNAPRTYRG